MDKSRIEFLRAKERDIRAALAAEQMKLAKREKLNAEKLEAIIGAAVVKAAAASPDFRLMIAQTALVHVTDEKQRQFLKDRGWPV